MSYIDKDEFGMYKNTNSGGPGPQLMGAHTLLGNDVYNLQDEDLGDAFKQAVLRQLSSQLPDQDACNRSQSLQSTPGLGPFLHIPVVSDVQTQCFE